MGQVLLVNNIGSKKEFYRKEILQLHFLISIYGANNISVYIFCILFIQEGAEQHGNGCFLLETFAETSKMGANCIKNGSRYILDYTF